MENYQQSTCPVCHQGHLEFSFLASPLDYSSDGHWYRIEHCPVCGYGRTHVDTSSTEYYEDAAYDPTEKKWHTLLAPYLSHLEISKLKYLNCRNPAGSTLLEVGCGKGRLLEAAKDQGFEVYGLEPSRRSYSFASARIGSAVAPVGLETIDTVPGFPRQFDYIVLWHVLEHLDDPDAVLSRVNALLTDYGQVLVAVPNFNSLQARYGRADWYHLDPPRHIHHFTIGNIRTLAQRHGFRLDTIHYNSFYQNYVGELVTLTNKVLPAKNVIFNALRSNKAYLQRFGLVAASVQFFVCLLLSVALALPVAVLTMLLQVFRNSGTFIVLLRKIDESS